MIEKEVLIVDDDEEVLRYLETALLCHGYSVTVARDGLEAVELLAEQRRSIGLVILDLLLPGKDGIEALREIRSNWAELPVIALSGASEPWRSAEAFKFGANDYLPKPVAHEKLLETVRKHFGSAVTAPPKMQESSRREPGSICLNPEMRFIFQALESLAQWTVPVIFRGESGVGKEVLVRELHRLSPRASRPFVKINCAALPSELLESELFGYEKGAFTGAFKSSIGKFEIAHNGTIFLDEIGDMDFKLQAKLLQVLQDGEYYRLGGKQPVRVDVRIVAATHCDLESAVREGTFRQDLYYRLNVVSIDIPPLRDRREEIIPLAKFFLQKYGQSDHDIPEIPLQLREALLQYSWPGNVRELENNMRAFLIFRNPDQLAAKISTNAFESSQREPEGHGDGSPGSKDAGFRGPDIEPRTAIRHFDWAQQTDCWKQNTAGWMAAGGALYPRTFPNGEAPVTGLDGRERFRRAAEGFGRRPEENGWTRPYAERNSELSRTAVAESSRPGGAGSAAEALLETGADEAAAGAQILQPAGESMAVHGQSASAGQEGVAEGGRVPTLPELDSARTEAEKKVILTALARTNWNRKKAAKLLAVDYKALLYKMKRLGIQ